MNAMECISICETQEARKPCGNPPQQAEWAQKIADLYSQGTCRTIELAKVVATARRSLSRGEWSALWTLNVIPFSKRKGDMLVSIAKSLGDLPNEQTSAHLPQGWNILYQLSLLDRKTLENHILDGKVHVRLTLQGAKGLVRQFRGAFRSDKKSAKVKSWLKRLRKFVKDSSPRWSCDELELVASELVQLSHTVRKTMCQDVGMTVLLKPNAEILD